MRHDIWTYIMVMSVATIAIKALPLALIRRQIANPFLRSFLFYLPYVTLAVMTFPSIIQATQNPLAGVLALVLGVVLAWFGAGLPVVASACCLVVFVTESLLSAPV
ncbi:MAG: AzlD domain-containing protein [Sphaerochaetaceae bacterium]|nr:AzlD domain-containing protein [Spirochaetaceae bacterium]MDY6343470.1 AzlD domain-containing protein [Sphaerochaetaceae bacterium]